MASIPPINVPLKATLSTGLKCCPHTDKAIIDGTPVDDVPDAVTMAPVLQMFTVGTQKVPMPVVLPVCADCRKNQLGVVSKTGLVTA